MTGQKIILLLIFIGLIAAGQLLFKTGARALTSHHASTLLTQYFNWAIVLGAVLYAAATGLWIYILRDMPLNQAYPFTALGYVVVPVLSSLILGEAFSLRLGIGLALIIAGLWVLNQNS